MGFLYLNLKRDLNLKEGSILENANASLSLLTIMCLVLGATAFAGNLYSNGRANGTNDAYFIDVYQVSDQFPTSSGMRGFAIAEWVPAGATPLTFDWPVGSTSFGSDLGSGVVPSAAAAMVRPYCSAPTAAPLTVVSAPAASAMTSIRST